MTTGQFTERYLQAIDQQQVDTQKELEKHKLQQREDLIVLQQQISQLPTTIDSHTNEQPKEMQHTTRQHQYEPTQLHEELLPPQNRKTILIWSRA